MRIRTIKPEFWMHEGLCKCSEFTRLLAIALLNWADDEGYFMANPILIRGQVFPFLDDSKMIPRSLQELSREGWIRLGKDDQCRDVGMVINFAKHQRVDKPKPSIIKASSTFQDESKNDLGLIQDASKEEWNGMEQGTGKGIESFAPDGASSDPVPAIAWGDKAGFTGITDDDMARWTQAYPSVNLTRQIAAASEWLRANPAKRKKNYLRFLSTWFSRAQERGGDVASNRAIKPQTDSVHDMGMSRS